VNYVDVGGHASIPLLALPLREVRSSGLDSRRPLVALIVLRLRGEPMTQIEHCADQFVSISKAVHLQAKGNFQRCALEYLPNVYSRDRAQVWRLP
jgi:hypothetical protein